ncbi:HIT family protein [uncultured Roseibium sp.]|uniref:HIT domain-containing protein n=1 Tax=uncultured Roseibium sp. TaxID=1936171 RepID=UPI002597F6D4|nr:HIT family protein [uncultured Roseibium sp.]
MKTDRASMIAFDLNPRLEGDSHPVIDLELCAVRLMKDANYPWLLLIPRRKDLIEIIDLGPAERTKLMEEIGKVSEALKTATNCEKLNVAAIGNVVSQLHVHVVARFREDPAWPAPVWGAVPPVPYEGSKANDLISALQEALTD